MNTVGLESSMALEVCTLLVYLHPWLTSGYLISLNINYVALCDRLVSSKVCGDPR